MIVLSLALILLGSFTAAGTLAFQGASWGMIALGYVAGGWAGLILGVPLLLAILHAPRLWGGPSGPGGSAIAIGHPMPLHMGKSRH